MSKTVLRTARHDEHRAILEIAKRSPFTKDFSNAVMFSSEAAYEKGWIRVAEEDGKLVGFTCRRDKSRSPETVLYFIGVLDDRRRGGLGWRLIQDMMAHSPHRTLTLNCSLKNDVGQMFYAKHGFSMRGSSLGGEGTALAREFKK